MKWRDFMVKWLKRSIEGARSKGWCLVLYFSGVPQAMWVTQMTLGVKVFKGWCLFVLFQNVICVSQGCLVTGCIVGSPRPQSVFKGGFHWNSNHRQEGMTLSCCHQHFFLPNPKETDSIIFQWESRRGSQSPGSVSGPKTKEKPENFPLSQLSL